MPDPGQMILQSILSGMQQPTAQLAETQASAGAAGASAANSMSEVQARNQELKQQQFMIDTQKLFSANKDKSGHVKPETYNNQKELAGGLAIAGPAFDSAFKQGGFVDPKKEIFYNTQEGLDAQAQMDQVKRQVQSRLDAYNAIPKGQKGFLSSAQIDNIPFINVLAPVVAPHAITYDNNQKGFSAQLKGLAGAGSGSGVRANEVELGNWANFLPRASDTQTQVNDKISQLNNAIKAQYNVPQGLDTQYLPSKGRPSLSSFGQ